MTIQTIAKEYQKTKSHLTTLGLQLTQELSVTYKDHIYFPAFYTDTMYVLIESILDNKLDSLNINLEYAVIPCLENTNKEVGYLYTNKILTLKNIEEVLKKVKNE